MGAVRLAPMRRRDFPSDRRTSVRVVEMTTTQMGAIAEAATTYHATELGIVVLGRGPPLRPRPRHGRSPSADAVQMGSSQGRRGGHPNPYLPTHAEWVRSRNVLRVGGRRGRRMGPGTGECSFVAIADIGGQGFLPLRLAPARNNEELFVHWPSNHRLGAIAQLGERLTGSQEAGGSSPPSSIVEGPP